MEAACIVREGLVLCHQNGRTMLAIVLLLFFFVIHISVHKLAYLFVFSRGGDQLGFGLETAFSHGGTRWRRGWGVGQARKYSYQEAGTLFVLRNLPCTAGEENVLSGC